jgi:hypothetical protein
MATSELTRIHKRIDTLGQKIDNLHADLKAEMARCSLCRPIVLGNGREAIDARITALETVRGIGARALWAAIGLTGTLAGAISGAIVTILAKWWLSTLN